MEIRSLKVGDLAKRTGVSVRTLHYYDEIGLLSPAQQTPSGHRLYTEADVSRLMQIKSLQQLGFSLEEIRRCLESDDFSPLHVLRLHLGKLREQMQSMHKLCGRLEALAEYLEGNGTASLEDFLSIIEEMSMIEKYYTPEQLEELKARKEQVGEERIRQVEEEWQQLFADVRAEMAKGSDPASEAVQQLARKWQALIDEFTGGNPTIEHSLQEMYKHEGPAIGERHGFDFDPQMFEFMGKALAELKRGQ